MGAHNKCKQKIKLQFLNLPIFFLSFHKKRVFSLLNTKKIRCEFIKLFQEGKQFLYEMGEWLRARYGNFLGTTYHPDVGFKWIRLY